MDDNIKDVEWLRKLAERDGLSDADRERLGSVMDKVKNKDGDKEEAEDVWYGVIGIGLEGIEMFLMSKEWDRVSKNISSMKLRCRMNGHRDIRMYCFTSATKVSWEVAESKPFQELVKKKCKNIEW